MRRLLTLAIVVLCLAARLAQPAPAPAGAQAGVLAARNHYALPIYSYPDHAHPIIDVLRPRTELVVEARSSNTLWVLAHNLDRTARGWVEARLLSYDDRKAVLNLPISAELMFVASDSPRNGIYTDIDLDAYPIIPENLGAARKILERGLTYGVEPHALSKIGDCISDNQHFLTPFGWGQYALGNYTYLQPVVDYYTPALAYDSEAAYDGLVTTAVLDPAFADPAVCHPGESPLRCEYRLHRPAVAVIMFGAQDLLFTPPDLFDRNLRQIVHETIQHGTIPLLSTFPGNLDRWEQAARYNQIVVQVTLDYDVPLMNLWRALDVLPNHGLNEDGRHLSPPLTDSGDLRGENLQRGYPQRNLVTLQALNAVWRNVVAPVAGSLPSDVYTAAGIG